MGANVKAIRTRIRSVESTMHITKAMELVASSKLRRATERMERSRFFFETLEASFSDFGAGAKGSVYATRREVKNRVFVVIAGDRGLAGGYNNNIFKAVRERAGNLPYSILPIGRKAVEFGRRTAGSMIGNGYSSLEDFTMTDCAAVGRRLADGFRSGEFDEIVLFFTNYLTMLSQAPASLALLPLKPEATEGDGRPTGLVLYEPGVEAVLDAVVPEYLSGMVYGAICESFTSELAARRTAMDAASKNASAMIDSLSLRYNRARQSAITQEITEIVAGAN